MEVVKWTSWDDHFNSFAVDKAGEDILVYSNEAVDAVIDAIRKTKFYFDGEWHQYGEDGVPVFDNGTPFQVTQVVWDDIMSRAWEDDSMSLSDMQRKEMK